MKTGGFNDSLPYFEEPEISIDEALGLARESAS